MPSILFVEDTPEMLNMYSFALGQAGYEVTPATTGGEALARTEERQFDIILLDMMLSGMSGLDFLEASGVHEKCPNTKIIGFSNVDNPDIVERAKSHGLTDYLLKSDYEPKQLVDYLNNLLANPQVS